jgi:hypothetical protein
MKKYFFPENQIKSSKKRLVISIDKLRKMVKKQKDCYKFYRKILMEIDNLEMKPPSPSLSLLIKSLALSNETKNYLIDLLRISESREFGKEEKKDEFIMNRNAFREIKNWLKDEKNR